MVLGSGTSGRWAPGALGQSNRAVGTSARKDRCEASLDGAVGSSGMSCGHRARLVRTTGLLALARGSIVGEASWAMGVG